MATQKKAKDTYLSKLKALYENNKFVAVATIAVMALGTVASGWKSFQEIWSGFHASKPVWLLTLASNPLLPAYRMANIEIDMPEADAIRILGTPTAFPEQTVGHKNWLGTDITSQVNDGNPKNQVLEYFTHYDFDGVRLWFTSDRDSRRIRQIGFYCVPTNRSQCQNLPSYKGVSTGTSLASLRTNIPEAKFRPCKIPKLPPGYKFSEDKFCASEDYDIPGLSFVSDDKSSVVQAIVIYAR